MMATAASATRINRKRSHDDLEDADECLPISKRINSLHLEGQASAVGHQQVPGHLHMNPAVRGVNLADPLLASMPTLIPGLPGHMPTASALRSYPPLDVGTGMNNADLQMVSGHTVFSPLHGGGSGSRQANYGHHYHGHQPQTLHPSHLPPSLLHDPLSSEASLRTFPHHHHPHTSCQDPFGASANSLDALVAGPEDFVVSQQLPAGPYEPELDVSENPHYFSVNRLLYEAHLNRVHRTSSF